MIVTAWLDRISRYLHERKGALSKIVAGIIVAIFIVGLAGLAVLIAHKAFAGDVELRGDDAEPFGTMRPHESTQARR